MNAALLLDTNIISYLFKRTPEAAAYLSHLTDKNLFLCFQTIAELEYGVLKAGWGERRIAQLETYLQQYTIIPHSRNLSTAWAKAKDAAQRGGRYIDAADAWIAAAALEYGLGLVTHNPKDFLGVTGLHIITEA